MSNVMIAGVLAAVDTKFGKVIAEHPLFKSYADTNLASPLEVTDKIGDAGLKLLEKFLKERAELVYTKMEPTEKFQYCEKEVLKGKEAEDARLTYENISLQIKRVSYDKTVTAKEKRGKSDKKTIYVTFGKALDKGGMPLMVGNEVLLDREFSFKTEDTGVGRYFLTSRTGDVVVFPTAIIDSEAADAVKIYTDVKYFKDSIAGNGTLDPALETQIEQFWTANAVNGGTKLVIKHFKRENPVYSDFLIPLDLDATEEANLKTKFAGHSKADDAASLSVATTLANMKAQELLDSNPKAAAAKKARAEAIKKYAAELREDNPAMTRIESMETAAFEFDNGLLVG